jgi:hypothetical protein
MPDLVERLKFLAAQNEIEFVAGPGLCAQAAAEIARLRARPTEEEVARAISSTRGNGPWQTWLPAARAVLSLFPKVQP